MSDIDFSKIKLPQPNFDYVNDMISSIQRSQEESLRAVQKAREAKEAEELRRHNELVAALKEAGEKGATIVIGNNANGIQIQQNSAGAQQKMDNEQTFNYEKASEVLKEISTYFEFPQFQQTFGDNTENVKSIIQNTIAALNKKEDEGLIKKSLKVLKDLAIGFRVIIMTVANSSVKSKVLKLLPKLKTEETDGLCVA